VENFVAESNFIFFKFIFIFGLQNLAYDLKLNGKLTVNYVSYFVGNLWVARFLIFFVSIRDAPLNI
jgi:hypothetical protein